MTTALQRTRKAKGITQTWIAKQLGIHRTTYINYETGKHRVPRSVLFHAAHLLNISPLDLVDEAE